ncbi:Hpt domain-containing protein [Exiguobacterium acetylicum]|uniref:Hpt domain-containing protein n=2 Tax=Bacillales Family XII. Incertae Sedis TaxID=539742 RepID=UPI000448193C|nr:MULTISPECIES: Hpt domain-containing protein [Exiguobacterium]EZP61792.1 Hpt domain protein [Exiguobacterium sp. RIT341]KQS44843.1 Hpt protein [Exiguobacterium sp. Leaf196]MDQ6466166.1 Hpt domain-containing protein [Exiguobacterium acetylicum]MDT0171667.1 Hpt domain-containing protein [Exiguobacterium sp. BRG2]HAB33137.1 Hpt domain-containing protein [Exiguobacterium sp.]
MPFFNAKKLEELQSIAGGDHAFLQKIGETYIAQFDRKFPELKDAVAKQDAEQTEKLAHLLKGASYSVAADDLADDFELLEKEAESGSMTGTQEIVDRIEDSMVEFRVIWLDVFTGKNLDVLR